MAEFAAPVSVGNDILDIGSRKARRQRGGFDPMAPHSALTLGRPAQFDVPNVSNVRFTRIFGSIKNPLGLVCRRDDV